MSQAPDHPSRREAIAWLAGASAGLVAALPAALGERPSLGALAAAKGIRFGASFASHELDAAYGADYAAIYRQDCRILTSELELKMGTLRPSADIIDFAPADRFMAFAEANGMAVRGHTLIWNDALPPWIHRLGPGEVEHLHEAHIETMLDRYRGRILHWDVVNEPLGPWDRLPGNLRTGVFLDAMGEDYIGRSFRIARKVDPKVKLVLNEGGTESADEQGDTYRTSLLALIDRLRDKGTPIDAIGLECHLDSRRPYDNFSRFADFVSQLAERDFEIHLTELDVNDAAFTGSIEDRDRQVAALYGGILRAVLPIKAVTTVLTWQLADHTSWLYGAAKQAGKTLPRSLPYDSRFKTKPAWTAIAEAFEAAPRR